MIDPLDTAKTATADAETSKQPLEPAKSTFGSALSDKPQASSSSFASSGFGSLAGSSTSPFGALGASKPSVFGGSTQATISGFAALAGSSKSPSTVPPSDLGAKPADKPATGFGFGTTTTSSFGGLAGGSAFGSGLGNGFAGGAGPKLSSFAAPPGKQDITLGAKPAKAFGAPDSDEEEGSEAEDSEGDADTDEEEGVKVTVEDKKRFKVTKGMHAMFENDLSCHYKVDVLTVIFQFILKTANPEKPPYCKCAQSSSPSNPKKRDGKSAA